MPALNLNLIQHKSALVRRHVVEMANRGQTSHVGSSLSCVDLLCALYFSTLNIDPLKWNAPEMDCFILSKGHAVMAWFATLAEAGFFDKDWLREYAQDGGRLGEHPDHGVVPGIKVTTGSLGHGLSIGVGMAIARKLNRIPSRIFVMISDGECNEGSVWEAAMFAAKEQLDNLTVIIDDNKIQALGRSREVNALDPLDGKWRSFGWAVREIDGHDLKSIVTTLENLPFQKGKPNCLVANTVLGKGVSFMENDLLWHYQIPSEAQVKSALDEISLFPAGKEKRGGKSF